jgi:cysteine desulfurase/selenocysteine lyase
MWSISTKATSWWAGAVGWLPLVSQLSQLSHTPPASVGGTGARWQDGAVPAIDVERARAETPGSTHVTHLNNAGTSLPPRPVLEAQVGWLEEEAVTGGYELAERRAGDLEAAYRAVTDLIGAAPGEIALMENATFAWHQAFWSLPLRPGDVVLTSTVEYASAYISFLQAQRRRGISVEVVPDDESGQLSVEALARRLEAVPDRRGGPGRIGLVALPHVPTNGGLVNPVEEIGRLTRAAGVPFLLDACQSVGQLPVDVDAIGCDMLSATGRKWLRGPRGTGFLYVRQGFVDRLDPAFLDLHGATWTATDRFEVRPGARRFESWESNDAARVGLGVAAAYARSWGIDAIAARVTELAAELRERLGELPGVQVHDRGPRRCGIVTFSKDGVDATRAKQQLVASGINVSVSEPPSTRLDAELRHLPPLVRASPHYYNDSSDLALLVAAVATL